MKGKFNELKNLFESESYQLKNQQLIDKVIIMEFIDKCNGKLLVVISATLH